MRFLNAPKSPHHLAPILMPSQVEIFYHAFSESEWSDSELAPEMASEKAEAPAILHDIYPTPATIVTDMREFAKSMAPCKFTKIENAATRLVAKFKKALVCPKCEVLHGHLHLSTYQHMAFWTFYVCYCLSLDQIPRRIIDTGNTQIINIHLYGTFDLHHKRSHNSP
jgi:hypothetical protein